MCAICVNPPACALPLSSACWLFLCSWSERKPEAQRLTRFGHAQRDPKPDLITSLHEPYWIARLRLQEWGLALHANNRLRIVILIGPAFSRQRCAKNHDGKVDLLSSVMPIFDGLLAAFRPNEAIKRGYPKHPDKAGRHVLFWNVQYGFFRHRRRTDISDAIFA